MRYIKLCALACKDMWKHKIAYGVLIFELVLVEILMLSFGAKWKGIADSREICNVFQNENMYYYMKYRFTTKELEEILSPNVKENIQTVEVPNMVLRSELTGEYTAYGYNDLMIKNTHCKMSEGVWFDKYKGKNIPVVAADPDLKVGQLLEIGKGNHKCIVEIIGKIDLNSYIFGFNGGASNHEGSLENFITHPDVQLVVPFQTREIRTLEKKYIESYDAGTAQMFFLSDASLGKEFVKQCHEYGAVTDFNQMSENYNNKIRNEWFLNALVFVVFLVISIVGLIGFNGVQSAKNEKRYLIYYFSGGKSSDFVFIEIVKNILMVMAAIGVFVMIYVKSDFLQNDKLSVVSNSTIAITFSVLTLICVITSVSYIQKIRRTQWINAYKNKR